MGLKRYIKERIIVAGILKKRREQPLDIEEYERFTLPADAGPLMNNSYYFGGSSTDGESLIFRCAFRSHLSELFIMYTKNGRLLVSPEQQFTPDGCPVKVECMEPGRLWHMTFVGDLRDESTGEILPSGFDITFTARLPIFDSMHHSDPRTMARGFAAEKWNRKFFAEAMSSDMGMSSSLDRGDAEAVKARQKQQEQHHCEQAGHFDGTITIAGETSVINLHATRDHSYGKRDWNYMNDHIWLMPITEKGETLNLQLVNYPPVKRIFLGYSNIGSDRNWSMKDYKILEYDHNDGLGSDVIVLDCRFNDGRKYRVRAERKCNILTPFDGGNFYFQEGIADYDINGIKARGTIEYGFNRDRSRWDGYNF